MTEDILKVWLEKLIDGENLSREESYEVFDMILKGKLMPSQIASFLVSLKIKGETVEEIAGAATAMRENSISNNLPYIAGMNLIDTCGTGGDRKNTFNISTCSALVAAGAGVKIAKHGNYAVSSKSGSADVLKALGVNIEIEPEKVLKSIDYSNIGFLFAQKFHAAMKHAAPVRKELGVKTIFNILGPLTNPFGVKKQIVGVYSPELAPKMAETLKMLGVEKAFVVHGRDGIDEVSLSAPTDIFEIDGENIRQFEFNPEEYGFPLYGEEEFKSYSADSNARIILDILGGLKSGRSEIAILNAGFAILLSGKADGLAEAFDAARQSIQSGRAFNSFQKLVEISNG